MFIRALQLLRTHNEGAVLVGLAGASGSGKTAFSERVRGFMPGVAIISMDNYNDASKLVGGGAGLQGSGRVPRRQGGGRLTRRRPPCLAWTVLRPSHGPAAWPRPRNSAAASGARMRPGQALLHRGLPCAPIPLCRIPPSLHARPQTPPPPRSAQTAAQPHPLRHPNPAPPPQIDSNFDDPRLTDYDLLLANLAELRAGRPAEVPRGLGGGGAGAGWGRGARAMAAAC